MILKKYRLLIGVMIFITFTLTAFAKSATMVKVERELAPKPDQALIIFMRASFVGSAISSSLFDITTTENKFLGVFKSGVKIAYDVDPGEHFFMVISESADFMKATVEAGKTYYALITPRPGGMKARFSLKPLRQSDIESKDFAKWNQKTDLVENNPETEEWAAANASDIQAKRDKWWPAWCRLSPERLDSMTLKVEDGI